MHSFYSSRQKRTLLDSNGYTPVHFPFISYSSNSRTETKEDMKHTYGDTLFFNNVHLIPDPFKKNLADSVVAGEEKKETSMYETKEAERPRRPEYYYPSLAGITNFFSGVLNVMGAMFQKRTPSPTSQYYDCFENYSEQQMAPSHWQSSNIEVQNKNEREPFTFASNNEVNTNLEVEMNVDCRLAASHCEEKLNQVRLLLNNKSKTNEKPKFHLNRPRKAFVEASSVEDSFEDAFSPEEDLTSLASDTYIEFYSPYNHHNEEFSSVDAPKVKTEVCIKEPLDVTSCLPVENVEKENLNKKTVINDNSFVTTQEIVSSCEDKLGKLKALLQKGKKVVDIEQKVIQKEPEKSIPIPLAVRNLENHNVLPNGTVLGLNEIDCTELQNSQDSDYFNEVTGKFFSTSVESDDSFQIVFSDSPSSCRKRIPSECDSEDSFIVFEESPDSCYTSHDVFGDDIDVNHSDSDSETDEDSGNTCKLAHNLSRTFGDLTDDDLYGHDVVDCAQVSNEICKENATEIEDKRSSPCEEKKSAKEKLSPKKVTFSSEPPKVHVMRVWAFAARQARVGHWERHALDRERFKRRIADVEMAISWVFKRQHRTRIVFQRFRPWWNAERRREVEEKREKEEREKELKKEENMEHKGEGNVINEIENLIDNTDKVNISEDVVVDSKQYSICNETTKEEAFDLNGFIDTKGDQVETEQTMECNKYNGKICNSSPNESDNLKVTVKHDTEISKPLETLYKDQYITIKQLSDHQNVTSNNSKNDEFRNDINNIKPEIATTNNIKLSDKFQDQLQIKGECADS